MHPIRAAIISLTENPVESVSSFIKEIILTNTIPGIVDNNSIQDAAIGVILKITTIVIKAQINPPIPK